MIGCAIFIAVVTLIYFSVAAYFNCEAHHDDVEVDKFRERYAIQLAKDRVALRGIWRGKQIASQPPQVVVPQVLPIDCTFERTENGT